MKVIQVSDVTDSILMGIIENRYKDTGFKDSKTKIVAEAIAKLAESINGKIVAEAIAKFAKSINGK